MFVKCASDRLGIGSPLLQTVIQVIDFDDLTTRVTTSIFEGDVAMFHIWYSRKARGGGGRSQFELTAKSKSLLCATLPRKGVAF